MTNWLRYNLQILNIFNILVRIWQNAWPTKTSSAYSSAFTFELQTNDDRTVKVVVQIPFLTAGLHTLGATVSMIIRRCAWIKCPWFLTVQIYTGLVNPFILAAVIVKLDQQPRKWRYFFWVKHSIICNSNGCNCRLH